MKLDFDPFKIPQAFSAWLLQATPEEQAHHAGVFAKRAIAASHILRAVIELRAAAAKVEDLRIELAIEELLDAARDLHDYDPTSD